MHYVPTNHAVIGSNQLLNLLTNNCRKKFVQHCDLISLNLGDVLYSPGDHIAHIYFPVEGIISLEKQIIGSPYLVVTLIGNEGMLSIGLILDVNISPCRAVVQKSGFALRIPVSIFIDQLKCNSALNLILKNYTFVAYSQVLQTVACNLFHLLENRLARLLLMFQDRLQSDELHITQELLAQMLGVRRVGVTKAAGSLQRQHLISYSRGNVIIHDTNGLKALSCVCYQTDKKTYANILHPKTSYIADDLALQVHN